MLTLGSSRRSPAPAPSGAVTSRPALGSVRALRVCSAMSEMHISGVPSPRTA